MTKEEALCFQVAATTNLLSSMMASGIKNFKVIYEAGNLEIGCPLF